jgi:hypothetical protein
MARFANRMFSRPWRPFCFAAFHSAALCLFARRAGRPGSFNKAHHSPRFRKREEIVEVILKASPKAEGFCAGLARRTKLA